MAEIKRKGEKGVTAKPKDMDINQNKTKTVKPSMNMRELAREKIRRQMEGQQVKGSKSKKVKDRKTPPKNLSLKSEKAKGKNYKSSLDRKVVEKDPESVLMKNYVKDARPGGRSGTGELQVFFFFNLTVPSFKPGFSNRDIGWDHRATFGQIGFSTALTRERKNWRGWLMDSREKDFEDNSSS